MGIDAGYFRNDQSLGIAIGNFANEMTALYVSAPNSPANFTEKPSPRHPASRLLPRFSFRFYISIPPRRVTANGHLEKRSARFSRARPTPSPRNLLERR